MNCLFVNPVNPTCGVHAYGKRLYECLAPSTRMRWTYAEPPTEGALRALTRMPTPDAVIYNWQGGIGGFLAGAPFAWLKCPQILVYHDLDVNESKWSAILFSDPGMSSRGKWHSIGRPLGRILERTLNPTLGLPVIGVHGFMGAWAPLVVERVLQEFPEAIVELHLPFATYGDADGRHARASAQRCQEMTQGTNVAVNVNHEFMDEDLLLDWLNVSDINCYFRPKEMHWRGVSSATDLAIASGVPLAINKSSAFRHLHNLSPSICIEDLSLKKILENGVTPLKPLYSRWAPDVIREQVERVIESL